MWVTLVPFFISCYYFREGKAHERMGIDMNTSEWKEAVIQNAILYLRENFSQESSGHDYQHALRVYRSATALAETENADLFTVQLAALLHDWDDVKISPETAKGKDRAVRFMRDQKLPPDTIQSICRLIDEISFNGTGDSVPSTIEGKCVQDADRLDALGAIGIARAFAYGGHHNRVMYDPQLSPRETMTEAEYRNGNSTTVNHFYEKLFRLKDLMNTPAAKALAEQREQFMREFLKQFIQEWNG